MPNTVTLFDLLTRHQVYLEGVKNYQSRKFSITLRELDKELKRLFANLEYDNLDALTKRELNQFLRDLRGAQRKVYDTYLEWTLADIRKFMEVDTEVSQELLEAGTDTTIEEAKKEKRGLPLFALSLFAGTQAANDKLWATISNSPLPANGKLLKPFIVGFTVSASKAVEDIIRKGYVNRWTVAETLRAIRGTKAKNYRDGVMAKLNRQSSAVAETSLQHTSAIVQAGIASIFFKRYIWVAILDGKTTEICIERNGRIYTFGKGPLPPAHINCRSKIVPTTAKEEIEKPSYFSWLKAQPEVIQNDILGKTSAEGLRSGRLGAKDFPKFIDMKPLSIDEFSKKRGVMKS